MGVTGVAALEEWCKRGVEGYEGVKITNMSSSWRDGLAFCALIHRYRPDLIEWDMLEQEDSVGNCSLAFRVAATELGIPPLLDVDDVVKHKNPDQRSIMTYLSQFYHKLEHNQSEIDSGFSSLKNSFKSTSSEEEVPKPLSTLPRRGAIHSLLDHHRRRPLSWHGSMEQESPPIEHENPFKQQFSGYIDYATTYENGDVPAFENRSEILRDKESYADQEKMKRRKRPDSLIVLPKTAKSRCKTQTKMARRMAKEFKQLKPHESQILQKREIKKMAENDNEYNHKKEMIKDKGDTNGESLSTAPYKLAAKQNLLKRRFFQPKSPQNQKEGIKIDLFKVKYEKIKSKSSLAAHYGNFMKNCVNTEKKLKISERLKLLSKIPDKELVIYKVLPNPNTQKLLSTHKEPADKYSIEYLWNIGASAQRDRRARIRYF